jgi:hypothetical protein
MAFPPVFTDVWDITQPPDTQAANLLGQDLRNLKLDIMQRMSLMSGTTANMPTPETVNATWGGSGFGLLFFATDTGIIWQWNGAAWVNITTFFVNRNTKFDDNVVHTFTNPNANQTGSTINIPASTLVVGSHVGIKGRMFLNASVVSGSNVFELVIGGVTAVLQQVPSSNLNGCYSLDAYFVVASAAVETGAGTITPPVGGNETSGINLPGAYNGAFTASAGVTITTNFTTTGSITGTVTFDQLSVTVF